MREHWYEIDALCKLNSIPFNPTGEKIRQDGLECLRVCLDLPPLEPPQNWPKFDPRQAR